MLACKRTIVLLDFLAPSLSRRTFKYASKSRIPAAKAMPKDNQSNIDSPILARIPLSVPLATKSQAESFNQAVIHIRRALQASSLTHVLERWELLQQNGLLHFLAHPDLQAIAAFVSQFFAEEKVVPLHLEEKIQDLSIYAAVIQSHEALNACMHHYFDAGDFHKVIDIYRRFMEAERKMNELKGEELPEGSEMAVPNDMADNEAKSMLAPGIPFGRDISAPAQVRTLLLVTAAFAKLDRLHDAYEVSLNTSVPLTFGETNNFLERFDLSFGSKLASFIECLKLAGIISSPVKLSKKIKYLAKSPSSDHLEEFYNEMIIAIEGPNAFLSVNPNTSPNHLAFVDESTWTFFLVAFIKSKRERLVTQIWKDMDRLGAKPGVRIFAAFINACDDIRDTNGAIAAWKLMHSRGVTPDSSVFRAIISALFWGKRKDAADKAFETYRVTVGRSASTEDKLVVYNTVLAGMLGLYREDHALNLLKDMEVEGPTPDVVSYNTFLSFYGRKANFKGLASMVERMTDHKTAGDIQSFSTILSALLKIGRDDAADLVFGIMKKQGIQPNVVTYTSILQFQLKEQTERNLHAALRLLHRMEEDPSLQPTEKTYATVLKGLTRERWLPAPRARQLRDDLLSRVRKRFVRMSEATYNVLLSSSLEDQTAHGLEDALAYYHHMKRSGTSGNWRTFFILLTGLRQHQEWAIADEVISDMYLAGIRPGKPLLAVVTKIKNRDRQAWE